MPLKVFSPQQQSTNLAGSARAIGGPAPLKQNLPSDSFGVAAINPGAVGNAVAKFGGDVARTARIVQATQQRIDTTKAEEALVNFERAKNKMFFEPETGYFNSQGQNAYESAGSVKEKLTELRRTSADGITSPQARGMFVNSSDAMLVRAETDIMRHASNQFSAWEASTLNARLENTLENATLYWNDSKQLGTQLELGRQTVIDIGKANGDGAEALAEKLQSFNSSFAIRTVEGALAQDAVSGQMALSNNAGLLEPQDLIKLQNQVDTKIKNEKNQMESQSAIISATALVDQFGDQSDARTAINQYVNTIQNPDLRAKIQREANFQLANKQAADSEFQAASFEKGQKILQNGGSVQQLIAADPEGWESLTAKQREVLTDGGVVVTDFTLYSSLKLLPRAELAKVNPADYIGQIDEGDLNSLLSAVKSAREGTPGSEIGRTRTGQMTSAVEGLFGPRKDWKGDVRPQVDQFYATVTAEASAREDQLGRELDINEYTKLMTDMTLVKVKERSLFGIDRLMSDTTQNMSDIPSEEVPQLRNYLRAMEFPFSAENMLNAMDSEIVDQIPIEEVAPLSKHLRDNGVIVNAQNLINAYNQVKQ